MGVLVLVLLVLAWAIVLVPSFLSPRTESSPIDGVRSFERSMGILANTRRRTQVPGRWVMVPKAPANAPARRRIRVVRRRRNAFIRIVATAIATLVLGLFPSMRFLWWAHLVTDAILVAYVFQLRRWRDEETTRRTATVPQPAEVEDVPIFEQPATDEADEPAAVASSG